MFLTAPIVWLQSWASPGLTLPMEVVSWFGYTRVAMALAVLVAFGVRLRAGLVLLLLLGLNSIATDLAKTAAGLPRPFAVDADVRILGWPAPLPHRWGTAATGWWDLPRPTPPPPVETASEAANAADSETGFGFPSGHVSTTVTFVAALGTLFGRRWVRIPGAVWLGAMAVSRLYLGRHFIGDAIGGLAVAALVLALGATVLRLPALATAASIAEAARAARRSAIVGAALLAAALTLGRPDIGDSGRLAGIAIAVLVLMRLGVVRLPPRVAVRVGLVAAAAVSYGLVWAAMTLGLPAASGPASSATRVAASVLPAFAMLAVPGAVIRRFASVHRPSRDD